MSKKFAVTAVLYTALAVSVAVMVVACGSAQKASISKATSTPSSTTFTISQYPPGVPAITPHLKSIPVYTVADVQKYVTTHGPEFATVQGSFTIGRIAFIPAQEASRLLKGESIGRPDNALVCYVELKGSFVYDGPMPPGARMPPSSTAVEIFDAQTGNLLMTSV